MNYLDLIPSPEISERAFLTGMAAIEANFGTKQSGEKVAMLFEMIHSEGWTEHRFKETAKWFMRTKRFPSWTVADWFDYGVKVYPRSWMVRKAYEGLDPKTDLECYELEGGDIVWKLRDGVSLPFKLREDLCGRRPKQ